MATYITDWSCGQGQTTGPSGIHVTKAPLLFQIKNRVWVSRARTCDLFCTQVTHCLDQRSICTQGSMHCLGSSVFLQLHPIIPHSGTCPPPGWLSLRLQVLDQLQCDSNPLWSPHLTTALRKDLLSNATFHGLSICNSNLVLAWVFLLAFISHLNQGGPHTWTVAAHVRSKRRFALPSIEEAQICRQQIGHPIANYHFCSASFFHHLIPSFCFLTEISQPNINITCIKTFLVLSNTDHSKFSSWK